MEEYYIIADLTREAQQKDGPMLKVGTKIYMGRIKTRIRASNWQDAMAEGEKIIKGNIKPGITATNFGWMPVKDALKMGDAKIYDDYPNATKLTYYRARAGITQQNLSEASGVNIRQIQKLESGEISAENVTAKNLIAIADALKINPKKLL